MKSSESTYEKVFAAADRLLAEGQRPTQQNVRNALGSGSLTTINKALNDWWKTLGERLFAERQRPDIPEPVFDCASTLWQQALAYADNQLTEQRSSLEQRFTELKGELDNQTRINREDLQRMQQVSDRLQQENSDYRQQLDELRRSERNTEEREFTLQSENRELKRQLKETELALEQVGNSYNPAAGHELLEYQHKNQYLEGECERINQHNQNLLKENQQLRDTLFETERLAMKDKHELQLVISQQDSRYRELEQQLSRSADTDQALVQIRLQEKQQEIDRLHQLMKDLTNKQ